MEICNAPSNAWIARKVPRKDGKTCTLNGRFWKCNTRLCPSCLADTARRSRAKLRHAWQQQKPQSGERYSFATFTIVNPSLPLVSTIRLVERTWTLFRKRKVSCDLIRGGCKSVEFTLTKRGFHVHLHCIFLSKFLLYSEIRRAWTECFIKACEEFHLELAIRNADAMLRVVIKPVSERERSIQEVSKYITKSDSWYKMPMSDLREIVMISRWNRAFELFGSFRTGHIVHTKCLNDGDQAVAKESARDALERAAICRTWRDILAYHGLETFKKFQANEVLRHQRARRYRLVVRWPGALLMTLDDLTVVPHPR